MLIHELFWKDFYHKIHLHRISTISEALFSHPWYHGVYTREGGDAWTGIRNEECLQLVCLSSPISFCMKTDFFRKIHTYCILWICLFVCLFFNLPDQYNFLHSHSLETNGNFLNTGKINDFHGICVKTNFTRAELRATASNSWVLTAATFEEKQSLKEG